MQIKEINKKYINDVRKFDLLKDYYKYYDLDISDDLDEIESKLDEEIERKREKKDMKKKMKMIMMMIIIGIVIENLKMMIEMIV